MADKVLTANRLSDGISVWLDASGAWAESLQDARVVKSAEDIAALEAMGKAAFLANTVVDANVIDVENRDGRLLPLRMRERVRAEGPTIDYAPGYKGLGPAA
ncbi:DUF2849 domain-containing protein [Ensifer soli]|uniref:DUF2849 domain-containing protein n=1 Tax=Ciceribacter sp. sgz301302 TaxID=3342379 RepID=UPI0035BA52B8